MYCICFQLEFLDWETNGTNDYMWVSGGSSMYLYQANPNTVSTYGQYMYVYWYSSQYTQFRGFKADIQAHGQSTATLEKYIAWMGGWIIILG